MDTHMAVWLLEGSTRLPPKALVLLLDGDNQVYVSDVSAWEVAIKHQARPTGIPGTAAEFMAGCEEAGYLWLPLTREAVRAYESLDIGAAAGIHRDPFDRMLIAQSKAAGMPLLTHDRGLALYGEPLVMVV